jgi:hypothetical protein
MEIVRLADKRRYPRVDEDKLLVYYRKITRKKTAHIDLKYHPTRVVLNQDVSGLYKELEKKDPVTVRLIRMLDEKLNSLVDILQDIATPSMRLAERTHVNFSAGGLRFRATESFMVGDTLEICFIVLPALFSIKCICEVVRVVKGGDDIEPYYDIAVRYQQLHREDKEKVIKYIENIGGGR